MRTALFCLEASFRRGAGHAIRSSVIADELAARGWGCHFVTHQETYEFIPDLKRFPRHDPQEFQKKPLTCDLLVVDNYDLDIEFEAQMRPYTKKILVIDDLANRKHNCDLLLDQAYGRDPEDYRKLVPSHCQIFTGPNYALLRKEFVDLREDALKKRSRTREIKRVLISTGGADPLNYTGKVLKVLNGSGFKGSIDIILGFTSMNRDAIETYSKNLSNEVNIYVNPKVSKHIFDADFAIASAGSGVWERCCLGLPQCLIQTADNQEFFLSKMRSFCPILDIHHENAAQEMARIFNFVSQKYKEYMQQSASLLDSKGTERIINAIEEGALF